MLSFLPGFDDLLGGARRQTDANKGIKPEPMFPKDLNESTFRERFGQLEPDLVKEWQKAVRKQNPNWAGNAEGN